MTHRRDILRTFGGLALTSTALAGMAAPPSRAQSTFASSRIAVSTQGLGADLILIPGLASTADVWRATAARLEGQCRLHLISVRGFGELPAQANANGPILGPIADDIRRYIAEQRLERPAIIGHSMGGQIGVRVAADAGDRVDRVMTVDSSPFFPALISPQATARDVEPLAQVAYQALQFLGDEVLLSRSRAMGVELGGASDALFGSIGWQGGDRRVLAQALYEVMTVDLRPRLADVRVPVTVAYGWSPDEASARSRTDALFRAAYARLPTPAIFERIEGAEHMVMIDQPTRFLAAVNRFLA